MMMDKKQREWEVEDFVAWFDDRVPSMQQYWDADEKVYAREEAEEDFNIVREDLEEELYCLYDRGYDEAALNCHHATRGLEESMRVSYASHLGTEILQEIPTGLAIRFNAVTAEIRAELEDAFEAQILPRVEESTYHILDSWSPWMSGDSVAA